MHTDHTGSGGPLHAPTEARQGRGPTGEQSEPADRGSEVSAAPTGERSEPAYAVIDRGGDWLRWRKPDTASHPSGSRMRRYVKYWP